MSSSGAVLEKPAPSRLNAYKNYFNTFFNVHNVPQSFNDSCLKELDCYPEHIPGTNHNFYFQVAAAYGAMSVYHPERSPDCERIKRYYQTIVFHAFENNIDAIAARNQVNKDIALLGYVYYGQQNKSISLHEWQVEWAALKQKVAELNGGIEELNK